VGVLVVLANGLLRGGVDPLSIGGSALAVAAMLALAPGRGETRVALSPLAVGLAIAICWIGLQLVPLPPAFLSFVSPQTGATLRDSFAVAAIPLGWRPLTLDPAQTARELASAVTLTGVVAASAVLAASGRKRDLLLRGVAFSGVVVNAVSIVAALLGLAPLVEPRVTFVNPNHLAGFLLLTSFSALGLALGSRGPSRIAWLVAFGFTGAGVFLSLSRAGIAAFVVGAGAFALLRISQGPPAAGEGAPPRPARRAGVGAGRAAAMGLSAALAIASFLALEPVLSELRTLRHASSEVKFDLFADSLRIARDFPLVGIGRGAFSNVYPAYKWQPTQLTFTHVENEWLQLPIELGVPMGIAVVALFCWALLAAAARRDLPASLAGALAGVTALAAQNGFDFSLEFLGAAVPFAIVLGIASREMRPSFQVRPVTLRLAALCGLVVALVGLLVHGAHRNDVASVVAADGPDAALSAARAALPWHPADYVVPGVVGQKLVAARRCNEAVPWLTQAALRSPTAPEPHAALAVCLARAGKRELAAREFRLAFSYGDESALGEAAAWYPQPGSLLAIAPDTPEGLLAAGSLLRRDRPREAAVAWRRAWEEFGDTKALANLAYVQLDLKKLDEALRLARLLEHAKPPSEHGYVVAARALDLLGQPDDAQRELELGVARFPGSEALLLPLGERQLRHRYFSQARATFESIAARDAGGVIRKQLWIAHALEGQGRYQEALAVVQTARDAASQDLGVLEAFSSLAAMVGRFDEAIDALEIASRRPDARPGAYDARLSALRDARERQRLKQQLDAPR
jgi:tetratricopeptide (TPR) repeat protein